MSKRVLNVSIAVALAAVVITPALAQGGGQATVDARIAAMKTMGGDLRGVSEQARQPMPDMAVVKASAAKVKASADALAGWFPAGTGPDAGLKTRAKGEIWTDAAGWTAAVDAYKAEADKLVALAGGAPTPQELLDAAGAANRACAGCHAKYRGPPLP